MSMKKIMLIVGFVLVAVVAKSQDSYIVKTNNVKLTEKTATTTNDAAAEQEQKKEQEDFVGRTLNIAASATGLRA
jgi:diphthamide synthase (EF-2-diphthine--ammonia ligase)